MIIRNVIWLVLLLSVSSCFYNIAPQKRFDFSATYYMDGTCEILLPNRNRVYVHKGKYFSEFTEGHNYFKIAYKLYCVSLVPVPNGDLGPVRFTTGIHVKNEQPILFIDENHMELAHRLPPVSWQDHDYRFIQFEDDVVLDGREGASQLGLDNYFQFVENRAANFSLGLGFQIIWSRISDYAKQLPGFTREPCPSHFSSSEIIFRINGRKKAEETGIYAELEGENGELVSSSCK